MPFRLRTFGGLSLTGESGPVTGAAAQRRKLALLAVLATGGERGISRDRLLALFWPERDAEHARHALTQSLSALRHELGSDKIFLGTADLSLNPTIIGSDVATLETALARAELESAVALYVSPFLDGIHLDHAHASPEFERWVEAERARLAGLVADALERLAVADTERQEHRRAVEWWRRLAALDPYSTRSAVGLMTALAAAGDASGALRHAQVYETLLRNDLNLEPDGALLAMVRRLHRGVELSPKPPPRAGADSVPAPVVRGDEALAVELSPSPRPLVSRWRWLPLGLGLATVGAVAGGALLTRSHARPVLDPNLIAVAPFDVFDAKLELWREGLVDVLSRDLDGAGPLRTVSPTVVIRRWSGQGDPDAAVTLGRATGAGLAVFGTVLRAGPDSIRLTATLVDVARNEVAGEVQLKASGDRMDLVTDSITRGVLGELNRRRPIAAHPFASVGSNSGPALKAFLRGEQFYRHTAWDSAVAYYRLAVALDSTFAPALSHLGQVDGWVERTREGPSQVYAFRSAAFNRGLAPRDSLLIVADSLFEALRGFTEDTAWWSQSRRLLATLEKATERYPDDPEVWFQVGEARTHFGYWQGITRAQALAAFDHAITLDSGFAPAYIHPIRLAGDLYGLPAARRYAAAYLALNPSDIEAAGIRLAWRLMALTRPGSPAVELLLDTVSSDALMSALDPLPEGADSTEPELHMVRLIISDRVTTDTRMRDSSVLDPAFRLSLMSHALAYRGHAAAAYHLTGYRLPELFGELVALGAVPDDSARVQFDRWLTRRLASAAAVGLPWWAASGDTASIRRFVALSDSVVPAGSAQERRLRLYDAARGSAYLALAQRDTDAALRAFEALPDSLCGGCREAFPWTHLTRAELLTARGRGDEAVRLLAPGVPWWPRPLTVLTALARARAADRVGDRDQAMRDYHFVASAWAHADAELTPVVAEASAAVARLSGEHPH